MVRRLQSSIGQYEGHLIFRYRGTKELSNGAKYTITREGDTCVLLINNVTADDADEYSIKARNKGGARMSRCNVNVRCKKAIFGSAVDDKSFL
jgi:hypothetical protein